MRAVAIAALLFAVVAMPRVGDAQVYSVETPPPAVTAARSPWQLAGEPIFHAGSYYYPTGPTVFFDGRVMTRTGVYEGVPLYEDVTLEPYSIVYVPIGGAAMIETGAELRVPFELFGIPMGAAAFLDGGDVTDKPSQLDVRNLHWAAGIGIRPYYLPIGPIRLDFAYRLNRTGPTDPLPGERFSFIFSLGEAF